MTDFEIGYMAGFMDGEGAISIYRSSPTHNVPLGHHTLRIIVVNNFKSGLDLFAQYGGKLLQRRDGAYYWSINGKRAGKFLQLIHPYLHIKQKQAEKAITLANLLGEQGNNKRLSSEELRQREQIVWEFRQAFISGKNIPKGEANNANNKTSG